MTIGGTLVVQVTRRNPKRLAEGRHHDCDPGSSGHRRSSVFVFALEGLELHLELVDERLQLLDPLGSRRLLLGAVGDRLGLAAAPPPVFPAFPALVSREAVALSASFLASSRSSARFLSRAAIFSASFLARSFCWICLFSASSFVRSFIWISLTAAAVSLSRAFLALASSSARFLSDCGGLIGLLLRLIGIDGPLLGHGRRFIGELLGLLGL